MFWPVAACAGFVALSLRYINHMAILGFREANGSPYFVEDFVMNGNNNEFSKEFVVSGLQVGGMFVVCVAILAFSHVVINKSNDQDHTKLLSRIDTEKSFVFASVEACSEKGFAPVLCIASKAAAFKVPYGSKLVYGSLDKCQAKHGDACKENNWGDGLNVYSDYRPNIVGWQALAADLKEVAPLYATRDATMGVRFDGKLIKLEK